jgi:gliding motility-associated-like protein
MKRTRIFISSLLLITGSAGFAQLPGYSWYKILTIQSAQVQGPGNHADFPVLINHTDADLRSVGNGGMVEVTNGWDIKFSAADGITPLEHQLEKWDSVTGQIVAWVKVPSVSSSLNTDIRIYYGNTAVASDPSVSTTWDANFVGVWHLNVDEKDGSANANNLTNNSTTNDNTGIAAAGQNFSPTQFLSRSSSATLAVSGDLTIETWIKLNSLQGSTNDNLIVAHGGAGEGSAENYLYSLSIDPGNILRAYWEFGNGTDEVVLSTTAATLSPGAWTHLTVVRDAASKLVYFYENGIQIGAPVSFANDANGGSGNSFQLGSDQNIPTNDLDGSLDEIRISNSARSAEWIKTNYNSISAPLSFYTIGSAVSTCTANPTAADAGADQDICGTSATMAANTPSVGTGSWTIITGFGVISNASSPTTTITSLAQGPNTFRWKTENGTCPVSIDDVVITGNPVPSVANAGTDFSICSDSTNLAATTPTAGLGTWTLVGGSGTIASVNNPASAITGITSATSSFAWTISSGPCPVSADTIVVTVDTIPTTASAGTDQFTCNDTLFLNGNIPSVGNGAWSVVSGTGSITSPGTAAALVTGHGSGQNIFTWTISNGSCPVSIDTVVIGMDTLPSAAVAGTDQNICASSGVISANTPAVGSGSWSLVSGAANIVFPNNATTVVSSIGTGTNILVWSIVNGICAASTDTLIITRDANPTPADAGSDQITCTTSLNFAANTPSIGSGAWALISGSGTISNTSSPASTVSGLASGQNIFTWTVTNGNCPASTDTIIITVPSVQMQPDAGTDQTVCAGSANFNAPTPVGTGTWSLLSGSGVILSVNSPTSLVTNLSTGQNSFAWNTSYNSSCTGMTDTVIITVQASPTLSNAGADFSVCGNTVTLQGTNPSIGSGYWVLVSGSGTLTNANLFNTSVSGLSTGANSFAWTISNGICPSSTDTVIITSVVSATSANAGNDTTICVNSITLNANSPTSGTGTWSVIAGGATLSNPASTSATASSLQTGQNIFIWTISNGICPDSKDSVRVSVDATPTIADAGTDITSSQNTVVLNANSPVTGTGTWTNAGNGGNILTPGSNTSIFQVTEEGEYNLLWTISNGVCPASSDLVTIRISLIGIPEAISPNGDNVNDYFEIPSLKNSGQLTLRIFNRWGSEIYFSEDYKHDFNGISSTGTELADDTYFYHLDVNGVDNYSGYLTIKRK